MRKIGKHARGHFVAYLALFFALGGTSFAAVNALPKNSVGSPQIKNGAIQKVDISKKTVSALHGLRGPRGLTGATGATGATGPAGTPNPNANTLNGYSANELTRTAGLDVTADVNNWDGSALADSVNITAPRAGTLVLEYVFNAGTDAGETGSGTGYLNFTPRLDGSVTGGVSWDSMNFSDTPASGYITHTVMRTMPVAAGDHTVSVTAVGPGGTDLVFVFERSLNVSFVPFNGTGAASAPASSAAVQRPASTTGQ